jgi:glutamate dehydrogenase
MAQDAATAQDAAQQLTRALFAAAGPEGMIAPDAAFEADIAAAALDFMSAKQPGRPKVRVREATGRNAGQAVLEVLNDDMPFLVDSVLGEVQARGLNASLVLHPTLKVMRQPDGRLDQIMGTGDRNWGDGQQESLIIVLLAESPAVAGSDLAAAIETTLGDVRVAVGDWQTILGRFDRTIDALAGNPPPVAAGLLAESLAFCRWLRDGNFTFLGAREYRLSDAATGASEQIPVDGTGLGVLRDPSVHVLSRDGDALAMTPEIARFMLNPQPLIIAKSNVMSRVHRRVFMDYIGLKTYAKDGRLAGELRIVGLFTSRAYTQTPRHIPFLRHKVEHVIAESRFADGGHASKALVNILETFPRDELFQIGEKLLLEWARGIVDLELRPRVRVFARADRFDRFLSALVYTPRDRFSTGVRERIARLLCEAYEGTVTAFTPYFPEGPLVRVHFILARNQNRVVRQRTCAGRIDPEIRPGLLGWICRDVLGSTCRRRHRPHRTAGARPARRDRFLSRDRRSGCPGQGRRLPFRPADPVVGPGAGA